MNILITSILVLTIFLILCTFIQCYCWVRNDWVFAQRAKLLMNPNITLEEYRRYPSYEDMLYKYFWIWDINKFPIV